MDNKYTIKLISNRTGLSPQLIRTWEKRYNAITPQRTETKRRLYSESDLEKLMLLKRATAMGLAISTVAQLSIEELSKLVDNRTVKTSGDEVNQIVNEAADFHLRKCVQAIHLFDYAGLESALLTASSSLGQQPFIEQVIHPLIVHTGQCWMEGEYSISQEHMVSTIIRSILGSILVSGRVNSEGPTLLVTTPSRQLHELGALITAVTALSIGWQVVYLGPNLPVEEIANALTKYQADAVALSIIFPVGDAVLHTDLQRFRKIIGYDLPVIIGGRGASSYQETIDTIKAVIVKDLFEFKTVLLNYQKTTEIKTR